MMPAKKSAGARRFATIARVLVTNGRLAILA